MIRYQFCNEVFLSYDDEGYHIYVRNEKLNESQYTAEQLKNPLLAHKRFIDATNRYFYEKISEYISDSKRKKGLGCTSLYPDCKTCVQSGFYKQKNSECILDNKTALKIGSQNDDSNR